MRFGFLGIIAVAFLALEIVGIALIAGEIGILRTFIWLLLAAIAGGWLIRVAGTGFMPELMHATASGRDPFSVMWAAGRRFLAGVLLIFPGPISDVLAVILLLTAGLPRAATPATAGWGGHGGNGGNVGDGGGAGGYPPRRPQQKPDRGEGDVIEGEFRRED